MGNKPMWIGKKNEFRVLRSIKIGLWSDRKRSCGLMSIDLPYATAMRASGKEGKHVKQYTLVAQCSLWTQCYDKCWSGQAQQHYAAIKWSQLTTWILGWQTRMWKSGSGSMRSHFHTWIGHQSPKLNSILSFLCAGKRSDLTVPSTIIKKKVTLNLNKCCHHVAYV